MPMPLQNLGEHTLPRFNKWNVFGVRKWKHAIMVEGGDNINGIEFVLPARDYGNWDCQASKGFDKHVPDGDASFC